MEDGQEDTAMRRPLTVAFDRERACAWLTESITRDGKAVPAPRFENWVVRGSPDWSRLSEMVAHAQRDGLLGGPYLAVELWVGRPRRGALLLVTVEINAGTSTPLRVVGTPVEAPTDIDVVKTLAVVLEVVARQVECILTATVAGVHALDAAEAIVSDGGPIKVSLMLDGWSATEEAYRLLGDFTFTVVPSDPADWQGWGRDKAAMMAAERFPGESPYRWSLAAVDGVNPVELASGTLAG